MTSAVMIARAMGQQRVQTTRNQRLTFGRYVLDLQRGSLLLDGREITLRPKTFAVLRYLVHIPAG